MFDPVAQEQFQYLPDLPNLDAHIARRMLSQAYLSVIQLRTESTFDRDELSQTINYLRRLASTVEFYAVLDDDVDENTRRAGAFITAESLGLLADIYDQIKPIEPQVSRIRHDGVYTRIESSILYLIAQYDANAAGVLREISDAGDVDRSIGEQASEWCLDVLVSLCTLRLNPLPPRTCPVPFVTSGGLDALEMHDDTVGRLYGVLGEAVSHFMAWLAGERLQGADEADEKLSTLLNSLSPQEVRAGPHLGLGGDYARVRHLARLLKMCLPEISARSLIETIPPSPGFSVEQYSTYLRWRACGSTAGDAGRSVLWPSAKSYADNCILGGFFCKLGDRG